MPKVGKKKFPYTKKGKEAAEKESKKEGMPMEMKEPMHRVKMANKKRSKKMKRG